MLQWLCNNWIEIIGAILALLYLWLEIKQRNAMWVVGIISSLFYIYIFYTAKIYADMGMNIYYIGAYIYGFILWRRRSSDDGCTSSALSMQAEPARRDETSQEPRPNAAIRVSCTPLKTALYLAGITLFLWAILSFVLIRFTDSPVPFIDALTTSLSIIATWMLAHKYIEQWWVWLAVNIISVGLFLYRGLYPTTVLYLIYSIASVIGYFQWKKTGDNC